MKKGFLDTDKSLFLMFFVGRYFVVTIGILIAIVNMISWDFSGCKEVCGNYLATFSSVYPNIEKQINLNFGINDFRVGTTVLVDLMGTIFLPVSLYMGMKKSIYLDAEKIKNITSGRILYGMIVLPVFFVGAYYSTSRFAGDKNTFLLRKFFEESDFNFSAALVLFWWVTNLLLFLSMLFVSLGLKKIFYRGV